MAGRKLRLEVQQSNEQGVCVNPKVPRWFGQNSITTGDITGSVMKILITDSNGQQISITIGNNGSIQGVKKNGENKENHLIRLSPNDLEIEKRMNRNGNTQLPHIVNNQQSIKEIPNSNSVSVKEELEENEEPATESSISFKEVIGVVSEGYKLDPFEPEVEEVFHTETEEIKSEELNLAVKYETVDIDSEISLPENNETPRDEQSSKISDPIIQSTNDITSLCRLCATQRTDMIYIFIPNEAYENIIGKIQDCLPILVRDTDKLPKQVCRWCLEKLEMFHKFYKTVVEAERQLNILSEKISEELEIAKNIDKTLPPHIVKPNGEKSSKELVSDKEPPISHRPCSLPPLERPEPLKSGKKLAYKKYTDGEIVFMEETAISNLFEEGPDIIRCRVCGLYFGSVRGCYMHASIHYSENYYPCNMCDKICDNAADSSKHSAQHVVRRKVRKRAVISKMNISNCILGSTSITDKDNSDDNIICGQKAVKDQNSVEKIDENIIKCRICCRYFSSVESCYRHSSNHASDNFWPCNLCDKISLNAKESWEHSRKHLVHKPPHREVAKRAKTLFDVNPKSPPVTKSKILLKSTVVIVRDNKTDDNINRGKEPVENQASIRKSNNDSMIKCRICDVTFPDKMSCYSHAKVHVNQYYWPCTMCYTSFTTQNRLWRHAVKHMKNKYDKKLYMYGCHTCGRKFLTKDRLQFHEIFHNPNIRPCYCELCDKGLASESSLYYHMLKVHERSKLSDQLQLDSHQFKYTNEHFGCSVCNKSFLSNDELKLHVQEQSCSVTSPTKAFCYYCGKMFSWKSTLTVHIALEHTDQYRHNMFPKTYARNEIENKCKVIPTDRRILNSTEPENGKNLHTKKKTSDHSLQGESFEAKKMRIENTNDKQC